MPRLSNNEINAAFETIEQLEAAKKQADYEAIIEAREDDLHFIEYLQEQDVYDDDRYYLDAEPNWCWFCGESWEWCDCGTYHD